MNYNFHPCRNFIKDFLNFKKMNIPEAIIPTSLCGGQYHNNNKKLKIGFKQIFQDSGQKSFSLHPPQILTPWISVSGPFWRRKPVHPLKMWKH